MDFADVQAEVERWFVERIACGDIARYTPAYNQALAAKDDLKGRLGKLLGALEPAFLPLPEKPSQPAPDDPAPEPASEPTADPETSKE